MRAREITAKISALTKLGRVDDAVKLFTSMLSDGARPSDVTLLCAIRAAAETSSTDIGSLGFHALAVKLGHDAVISVRTALIGLYSSLLDGRSVLKLYNQSKSTDLVLHSAAISAMAKTDQSPESLNVFRQTLSCTKPNSVIIMGALSACGFLRILQPCRELHGYGIKNFPTETNLQNSLINVYARCSRLDVSLVIFNAMEEKDVASWNTIIWRCSEHGSLAETLILFLRMTRDKTKPDVNHLMLALESCSRTKDWGFLLGIHGYISKSQPFSPSLMTMLLKAYGEFNSVDAARALFDDLHHPDVIAWSAMIAAYARSSSPHLAIKIFRKMETEDEEPNEITFVGLLQACSATSDIINGRTLHARTIRLNMGSNQFISSSLIDLYCKLGMLLKGTTVFDVVKDKDLVTWSSMIKGYGINGYGEESIKAYLDMIEQGLEPNRVVFVSLLTACSHCGLVDEGLFWFEKMERDYKLTPDLAHYSCIVDMLSRHGRVAEALEVIRKMPLKPDASIWGAIFAGCREVAEDLEVAEEAARWILRLDPGNSSCVVALSNLYASVGRWSDVHRIRDSLGETTGERKTFGYSLSTA